MRDGPVWQGADAGCTRAIGNTALQSNSWRVAQNLPDFDGKCAGMGMASCYVTVISPSSTVGHNYSFIRRTERGDVADLTGGCAIARKTVLSNANRHEIQR